MAATVVPIVHKVLSQDNYEIWSLRVKTYLHAKDLWSVVKPTNEAPKLEDNEVEFKVWSNRNAEALHAIHICCGDDMFPFVSGLDTAKAAWNSLEAKFKSTISQTTDERPAGNVVGTGNEPIETPAPLMTIEDLRREFNSDPGGNSDAELELILRVMQPLIPEYGFRNAFFIVLAKTGSLDGVKKIANLYPEEDNGRPGAQLISHCFYSQELDIALDLIRRCPTLAFAQDYNGDSTLYMLTSMRSLFLTGTRIGPWQKLIYNSIQIQPTASAVAGDICINVESTENGQANHRNLIIHSVMGCFRGLFTHLL
ncbi:hypothetical protein M0R45_005947 [Rubus argutus]|uniref:DUF4219 domain-containing protein n=1 Tax=Rubus argutus TaxID=59490 RepID=A0AAW1YP03_RUBAR